MSTFARQYLHELVDILQQIDFSILDMMVDQLEYLQKQMGRLFILGVGGSAANAAHAVNDFRKLAGIEAYSPSDNIAELTARVNDDGWQYAYRDWLLGSHLSRKDMLLILSVGGGNVEKNVSTNLVEAITLAEHLSVPVLGIVGRADGYTAQKADVCLVVAETSPERITPHAEEMQSIIWHLLVSDPRLKRFQTKW